MSIDGGYIKASLRQISSCRPQHIIQERNLETCHSCGTLETIFHHWWFSSRLLVVFTIDHYSVDFPHVRPQIHLFTWDEMYQVR